MSNVTRRALRVYMALSELKAQSGDVLDALIPFFEPILAVMHGKVFDPELLAKGAQKLYRWRINRDIAEAFIPRLVKMGYLKRCYVYPDHHGHGLQFRLMMARELKAKQLGWTHLVSECRVNNKHSTANFIKAGYVQCEPEQPWERDSVYWVKAI